MMTWLVEYLQVTWGIVLDLAPYLLLGMLVAGVLHVALPHGFAHAHFGRRGFLDVLKASALGVPMPLCSCGVIPAAIGLKKDGASNGAAMAFMISTPQTGADSVMVSASFLGWPFAIYSVFSTLAMGLVGGTLVNVVERGEAPVRAPAAPTLDAAGRRWRGGPVAELFRFGLGQLLRDIYRWVILGVLIAGLISVVVPPGHFSQYAWARGLWGMLLVLGISIPLYVCTTASIPIAASLIHAGLPVGSALVFLFAGPATNVATIGAVYKAFGRRVLTVYLGTVMTMSMALGWLFQSVVAPAAGGAQHGGHHLHGAAEAAASPVAVAAAIALLALMAWFAASDAAAAFARGRRRRQLRPSPAHADKEATMETLELKVEGMTCQNCVAHVRRALEGAAGARMARLQADVDLDRGRAVVTGERLNAPALIEAVAKAGYKASAA